MNGHWIFGYGYVGIGRGNDNTYFNWIHKDMTNIYIANLVRYGLIELILFLIINYLYYSNLYRAYKISNNNNDKWLIWCIMSALVGWNIAMLTVNALPIISTLLFILMAITQNLKKIILVKPD